MPLDSPYEISSSVITVHLATRARWGRQFPFAPTKANSLFLQGDAIIESYFLPPQPINKNVQAPRTLVPGLQAGLGGAGWAAPLWRGAPRCPHLGRSCPAAVPPPGRPQAGPIHHAEPLLLGVCPRDSVLPGAWSRHPSRTSALSVNFWVNCVSPRDLPFNPDTHESVNWASKGARGLLTPSLPVQPHIKRTQPAPHGCICPARGPAAPAQRPGPRRGPRPAHLNKRRAAPTHVRPPAGAGMGQPAQGQRSVQ